MRTRKSLRSTALLRPLSLTFLLAACSPAKADPLIYSTADNGTLLVTIDFGTGETTVIGPTMQPQALVGPVPVGQDRPPHWSCHGLRDDQQPGVYGISCYTRRHPLRRKRSRRKPLLDRPEHRCSDDGRSPGRWRHDGKDRRYDGRYGRHPNGNLY